MDYTIRPARASEKDVLEKLIAESASALSGGDYTASEIEAALTHIFGVDSELVEDGTYFVVEKQGEIAACGGWSRRKTLFGGDRYAKRDSALLDPLHDAAKIRAFFVHPNHARRGIGGMLLRHCEDAAAKSGFTHLEMMATLPGVKLYSACGYIEEEAVTYATPDGVDVRFVPMRKVL